MAIVCIIGMFVGAVLAMVTAASLGSTYAVRATPIEECVYGCNPISWYLTYLP